MQRESANISAKHRMNFNLKELQSHFISLSGFVIIDYIRLVVRLHIPVTISTYVYVAE